MQALGAERLIGRLYKSLPDHVTDSLDGKQVAGLIVSLAGVGAAHEIETCFEKIKGYRKVLKELQSIPQVAQRSPEWYAMRQKMLTASDTAQAMGLGKFGNRADLLTKKRNERKGILVPFKTLPPMKWGIMFEAMAARCYQAVRDNVEIHEFGLLCHPTLPYGASPDGITDLGIMIEIKCPYRRKINGEVLEQYAIQMQGQMAVCRLLECDFVECEMDCYNNEDEYLEAIADALDLEPANHGVIAEFNTAGVTSYIYSDIPSGPDGPEGIIRNIQNQSIALMRADPSVNLVRFHYWKLRKMLIQRIQYDPDYFNGTVVPEIVRFWDETGVEPTANAGGGSVDVGGSAVASSDVPKAKKKAKKTVV